ncbi:hypothetical protein [Eleftheria terrae]|nr:hypothetical protein [Eleftheria terrae]WKB53191.1 hypothetical protein N7L95_01955 [Eleftheria terrae]
MNAVRAVRRAWRWAALVLLCTGVSVAWYGWLSPRGQAALLGWVALCG